MVRAELSPLPPWAPDDILKELRFLHRALQMMPDVPVRWDMSLGQNLPGAQAQATTSEIAAELKDSIEWVNGFAADYPGKQIEPHDASQDFWVFLALAQVALDRYERGQSIEMGEA